MAKQLVKSTKQFDMIKSKLAFDNSQKKFKNNIQISTISTTFGQSSKHFEIHKQLFNQVWLKKLKICNNDVKYHLVSVVSTFYLNKKSAITS